MADPWKPIRHVRVGDQFVAVIDRQGLVSAAHEDAATADEQGRVRTRLVFDSNGQGIAMAKTDPVFRKSFAEADLVHADGQFIVAVSHRYCEQPIPERAPTTDMIHDFAKACEASGRSFYLLGAREHTNAGAAAKLKELYPKLNIIGRHHGFFQGREEEILADIDRCAPDFLWVGLGKPLEQEFCAQYKHRLNAVWTITCGGCFNFVTGEYQRAPLWMQDAGIEWMHRMMTQPRHLALRYIKTNPRAFAVALTQSGRQTKTMRFAD
ncbi:WecB/TagA/CpsF family glycosyltransferase [Erythrobacter litoralis]|uniref:WecB/TagA/CpsF family glycosyltransferase n=1 Tax=Erythrobacter litoralis TaxID=39960 RepID=UPI002435E372|nr:WecB/TagA/CpsF family glycosyltransferase [Erythrobacter litoralis]